MQPFDPSATPGLPLYKEVKRRILAALAIGEWKPGGLIPAEKELCKLFAVSIGTLRKAIDELVSENILVRHQGRGTFVVSHSRNHHFFHFFNITRHDGHKSYPTVELVRFSKSKADALACEKLGVAAGSKVFVIVNRLSLDGNKPIIDVITLPEHLFPGLTEQQLRQRTNTLYNFYQENFGLNVIRTEEHIRAMLADDELVEWLAVPAGTPLLQIGRSAYSYENQPVEWRITYVNTGQYEYAAKPAQ
ncbi:GntR family transcriptional regulator [Actimicrobium sp. CCC2.4]|uniref:GntR family transcriptional regulator n=1 Tax=Actimicrobium sp. CCC2.4 TaxID=3048606 RepID=UPI002AC8B039|nr:GntR family transcriptional regulator [Actimicrobium sp. CCC2.4]MEB0134004.1 GntR family transcriptional regulator [Actimicrobium sp. CCC2.4]WPX31540.1 GntR family transcriptional regulator [Actimicrobium sp. CCC2.4]